MRQRLSQSAGWLVLIAIVALAATMLVPAALGYKRYAITTGSMTGAINAGSLVFDRPIPSAELRVGDVITFGPPTGYDVSGMVTHRVHSLGRDPSGALAIQTKGDANNAPDEWTFTPKGTTVLRVSQHVPYLGRTFSTLSTPRGRMLAFAVPGLLIALSVLIGLWREAGEDVRRRRLEAAA
jgi:signal peptidase I